VPIHDRGKGDYDYDNKGKAEGREGKEIKSKIKRGRSAARSKDSRPKATNSVMPYPPRNFLGVQE
jgi:hypothetical protein